MKMAALADEPVVNVPMTVDVGGVLVNEDQISEAISILEEDQSTSVKQPLQRKDNPLWKADYHGVAAAYRSEHPDQELPPGTPTHHQPRVKIAFVKLLTGVRASFAQDVSDAQVTSPVDQALADAAHEVEQETEAEPLPDDDYDARQRVYAQIVRRRGQPKFRSLLLEAYSGRCAVTGCDAQDALEAAHILPYRGPESNTVYNGLLLRVDIHTLLDLQLLAIDPHSRQVVVSSRLSGTQYQSLSGTSLKEPASKAQRPSQHALDYLWQAFQANESYAGTAAG